MKSLGSGEIFSVTKDFSHHKWHSVLGISDSQKVLSLHPHVILCWDSVDSTVQIRFPVEHIRVWKRSVCISTICQSPSPDKHIHLVLMRGQQARMKLAATSLF